MGMMVLLPSAVTLQETRRSFRCDSCRKGPALRLSAPDQTRFPIAFDVFGQREVPALAVVGVPFDFDIAESRIEALRVSHWRPAVSTAASEEDVTAGFPGHPAPVCPFRSGAG